MLNLMDFTQASHWMKVSFKKALYAMAVALGLQSCSQAFIETPATPGRALKKGSF